MDTIKIIIILIAVFAILLAIGFYQNSDTVPTNWNYKQLTLFNHSMNNFTFTYSGDDQDDNGNFSKMINNINSNYPNLLFNINGGDLMSDTILMSNFKKEYLTPGKIAHFNKPVMFVMGNHELVDDPTGSKYNFIFGTPTYYNFSENNSYFIIIDNSNRESLNNTQLTWLNEQLKLSQKYKYRFVFMHVPLYIPNGETVKGMDTTGAGGADALQTLFDSYNVTMIFSSHVHSYYTGIWGKTPYIISGGAGGHPAKNELPDHHYIVVNVTNRLVTYTKVNY
jgi:Calcineurin-like phosphoesterase